MQPEIFFSWYWYIPMVQYHYRALDAKNCNGTESNKLFVKNEVGGCGCGFIMIIALNKQIWHSKWHKICQYLYQQINNSGPEKQKKWYRKWISLVTLASRLNYQIFNGLYSSSLTSWSLCFLSSWFIGVLSSKELPKICRTS